MRFSIRSLLIVTALLAFAIAIVLYANKPEPRAYHSIDHFLDPGWEIELAPDRLGPYRSAGDDRAGSLWFLMGIGEPAKGWVESGGIHKTVDHAGTPNVVYKWLPLEDTEDQPTFLILRQSR